MKILIACGTGEVCSTIIRFHVEELLKERNMEAEIVQCKLIDIAKNMEGTDLFIPAMEIDQKYDVPTIIGQNYLTEVDMEQTDKEIADFLDTYQKEQ
jgi:PTS system galactitol-specific IIB component